MISGIESGILGFDELTSADTKIGGIPEKSNTLVYGPPKTGKTILCNQFTYHGLLNGEPCLYITVDHGLKKLQSNMMDFQWLIQNYIENQTLYIIDGISHLSGAKLENTNNIKTSSAGNPADMMIKVGIGARSVYKKSDHFRSVLDSLNTILEFNPEQMVVRVLKAYLRRINEAGGTSIITYTTGITDTDTEKEIISLFDNTIRLDGQNIYVESHFESEEDYNFKSTYNITSNGIIISGS